LTFPIAISTKIVRKWFKVLGNKPTGGYLHKF